MSNIIRSIRRQSTGPIAWDMNKGSYTMTAFAYARREFKKALKRRWKRWCRKLAIRQKVERKK